MRNMSALFKTNTHTYPSQQRRLEHACRIALQISTGSKRAEGLKMLATHLSKYLATGILLE